MPNFIDRTGQRFGRLTALRRGPDRQWPSSRPTPTWTCLCDCGKTVTVDGVHLTSGRTKSCGCLNEIQRRENGKTHGRCNTTEHVIWRSMIQRCTNPKSPAYAIYGGRGVPVCDRWRAFENFYADMGPRPADMTLDRRDNNGPYSPENCRWATKEQQARNKSTTRLIEFQGRKVSLAELSELSGVPYTRLLGRLQRGYADEDLLRPKRTNQWR